MIDLQYYVQEKSRDEDMPERSGILVVANREAGGRDQPNVDLEEREFELEYGKGSCTRGRRREGFVVLISRC
jgi:hypothetical protein